MQLGAFAGESSLIFIFSENPHFEMNREQNPALEYKAMRSKHIQGIHMPELTNAVMTEGSSASREVWRTVCTDMTFTMNQPIQEVLAQS